jgi:hypothetical protein
LRRWCCNSIVAGAHVWRGCHPRPKSAAVESSADVHVNHELLIGSDLHFMAIALRGQTLDRARAMLLLSMGEGQLIFPNARHWHHPMALVGEVLP